MEKLLLDAKQSTVEPPLKGHPRDQDKCPLYHCRGVPSIEVTFIKILGTFFRFGTKVFP